VNRRWPLNALCATLLTVVVVSSAQTPSPQVNLNADNLAPRAIEQLTGANVAREYAKAWQDLEQALQQNQASLLKEQFTGFVLDRLSRRIADQQSNGLRTLIVDHGHRVKAVFYSQDGGAMQLVDNALLEVLVFDGNRLIDSEKAAHQYVVLMTPGTDRWYVRYLEQEPSPTQ
jgi:hypothetical protein